MNTKKEKSKIKYNKNQRWKGKTRVKSSNSRVTSWNPQVTSSNSQVRVQIHKLED